ncbi:MAG: biliverdin-producing heme oxygenase [Chthoniobacteraceae bacterium]
MSSSPVPSIQTVPELLLALRTATAAEHRALEDRLDLFNRVRTLSSYAAVLARFHRVVQPLEDLLAARVDWAAAGWNFAARLKTPWLVQDIRFLSGHAPTSHLAPPELPMIVGLGEGLGCLYVLEGSTLGGQGISRNFRANLEITPERGGAYFNAYGPQTGAYWKEFCQWAESVAEGDPALIETACRAARQTFVAFEQQLAVI